MQKPFELELTWFDRSKENRSGEVSVKKTVWKKLPRVLQEKDAVKYHTSGQKHAFDLEKQRFSLDLKNHTFFQLSRVLADRGKTATHRDSFIGCFQEPENLATL